MMLRIRGKVAGLALALGLVGCESRDSRPFANVPIELPRAEHGTPFDPKGCVVIAIVPSAAGEKVPADATILVASGKYELAQYVKARGPEQGREELVKALIAALKEQAAMREKVPKADRTASEVPVLVCADRRVGAEHFINVLMACARAELYKIHVRVADRDAAPAPVDLFGPALRCWLPMDRCPGSALNASCVRELRFGLTKSFFGVTECVITEVPLRALLQFDPLTDRSEAASGETKSGEAQPSPKRVSLFAEASRLPAEILRAKRAFDYELGKLASEHADIPLHVLEEGMPVTLDPAPDVPFQDLVTVLDACIGCGVKAIEFKAPEQK